MSQNSSYEIPVNLKLPTTKAYSILSLCEFWVTLVLYSMSLVLLLRILMTVWRKNRNSNKKSHLTRNPTLLLYFIAWTVEVIVSIPFCIYYIASWRPESYERDGPTWLWLVIWTFPLQAFVTTSVTTLTLERICCILWPGPRSQRRKWILTLFGVLVGGILACGAFVWFLSYFLPMPSKLDCAGFAGCLRVGCTNFCNRSKQVLSVINAILGIVFFVLLRQRWKSSVASKMGNHQLNIMAGVILIAEFSLNLLPVSIAQNVFYYCFDIAIAAFVGPVFFTLLTAMDVFVASIIYTAWLGARIFQK
ncbi:hypothetical protein DdX_13791 [Ditylenchus destructor]|uniref:Uncharacterized protein n=1 Tax=Ditylenchus destructor TaxID=166010 RepID=A0AAD4MSZ4_9BILA|nr:hypothetical protein DdX_13791 [Ditylenchus destructor]